MRYNKLRALILLFVSAFCLFGCLRAQDSSDVANPADSQDAVSFQTFYDSLASQGSWIQTDSYGYVWQPTVTDPNWAPYTNGHWVYTDAGWTWVSDEPWGWATYHYGRWVNLDGTGWCWVPGYTWAPAWVSWRYGDGYCGWAPLPPDSLVGVDYSDGSNDFGDGFHIGGDCDSYYGIGAGWYNFLPIVYLGDVNYRGFYANRHNNFRLINHTTNVTNLNINRRGGGNFGSVTLEGPSFLQVNAQSQTPIGRADLEFTDRVGGGAVNGRSLELFAPRVDVATVRTARPSNFTRANGNVNVNRGTDIARPLQVAPHISIDNPTPGEIAQARSAQNSAPTSANVATMNTAVRSNPGAPLTSMRPMTAVYEVSPSGDRGTRAYSTGGEYAPSRNSGLYQSGGASHFSGSTYGHSSSGAHSGGASGGSTHLGNAGLGNGGR